MAQSQNILHPPQPITIPSSLTTVIEAFSLESEDAAKILLKQAASAIYYEQKDEYFDVKPRNVTDEEVDGVYALMKAVKPRDMLETLCAAQVVVGHMLGMRKLAQNSKEDQRMGLKLLRLSNDAMERLEKKRNGANKNTNVVYNNHDPSKQALIS
jgi:hypothetical protein